MFKIAIMFNLKRNENALTVSIKNKKKYIYNVKKLKKKFFF